MFPRRIASFFSRDRDFQSDTALSETAQRTSVTLPFNAKDHVMSLVQQLTDRVGISQQQAAAAAGVIFKFAKEKLSGTEYAQLAESLPDNVDALISQAPDENGGASGLAGVVSAVGSKFGGVAQAAGLAGTLSKLGIDSSKIPQLLDTVKSYVEQHGGPTAKNLLSQITG